MTEGELPVMALVLLIAFREIRAIIQEVQRKRNGTAVDGDRCELARERSDALAKAIETSANIFQARHNTLATEIRNLEHIDNKIKDHTSEMVNILRRMEARGKF
jgi:hypothetical protein